MLTALLAAAALSGGAAGCQEDMPCWNWSFMGDHRRGIVTRAGGRHVVSPCKFQRLMRAGRIDYAASGALLGDTLALRVRCPS